MKNRLVMAAMAISFACSAQQELRLGVLPLVDGKVEYHRTFQIDTSKQELFNRAKLWFLDVYANYNAVVQMEDTTRGRLVGKGNFSETWQVTFYATQNITVHHTVDLKISNGQYDVTVKQLRVQYFVSGSQYIAAQNVDMGLETWPMTNGKNAQRIVGQINDRVLAIIESLEGWMKESH